LFGQHTPIQKPHFGSAYDCRLADLIPQLVQQITADRIGNSVKHWIVYQKKPGNQSRVEIHQCLGGGDISRMQTW